MILGDLMKIRSTMFAVLPLSLALALSLGACSSSADVTADTAADTAAEAASDTTAAATDTIAADAEFNKGDVTFAQDMIPHHQQAVEMAKIALDPARSASAAVKDLATRIQGAQGPEIELMTGWLSTWGQPIPAADSADSMEGHNMEGAKSAGMEGMMTAAEMTQLEAANGPAFDKLWLDMMIRHHKGAVNMSKTAQTAGKSAAVKELAAKIVTAQVAEIAEMQKLLAA